MKKLNYLLDSDPLLFKHNGAVKPRSYRGTCSLSIPLSPEQCFLINGTSDTNDYNERKI